jgi:membrane protein DedA with SNARE-associated domain
MSLPKFLLYTLAGCVIWNILLIYVGYYLGINWKAVADVSHYLIIVTVVALVLATVAYLIMRRNRKKKAQQLQPVKYVM